MLTLVSFDLCPYVQRAAITLAEKGIPFERRDVDLADKPAWFKSISPLGKVPLLQVDGEVLFESTVITEYLDETHGTKLHPEDALARARHRAWMEFGSSILADIWIIETTPDRVAFDGKAQALREKVGRLECELGNGPWFAGHRFCLVDAVFAPVFRYFDVFDRFLDLGTFDGLPKVQAWRRALAGRPSVRGAVAADYEAKLEAFLRRQKSWLATRLGNAGRRPCAPGTAVTASSPSPAFPLSAEETPMEVDGLVTALERIEHATRDFVHPAHKAEATAALLNVLEECGRALGNAHAIDPGLDDARNEASRHCAAVQKNLSAVLEEVRQLHVTVSGLLPTLVRIADRE